MSCILKINNIYSDMTDVDKKIADYINAAKVHRFVMCIKILWELGSLWINFPWEN